jgi:surface polysaccharide O-acyltransferase-like enzyme
MSTTLAAPAVPCAPAAAPSAPRQRLHYGDPIRIIGTIAVIVGHVCDMELFHWADYAAGGRMLDWWLCCVLDVCSRWAVPVFIMLSGALLLAPTSQTPVEFYRRRFFRVGVATMFWSPVFMVFAVWYLPETWGKTWPRVFNNLMLGQPYDHMHFLFRIVGLYLFTPALRVFVRHADPKMLLATVILLFGVAGGNSVVSVLAGAQPNAFSRFVPFLGYFLCGYLLRDVKVSARGLAWSWVGFFICAGIVSASMGVMLKEFGQQAPIIRGEGLALDPVYAAYPVAHMGLEFLNPVRIVMGLCVWFIFAGTFTKAPPDRQPWRWIAKVGAPATLGIYLVHPLFREVLYLKGFNATWMGAWFGIPGVSLMVLVPSVLLTVALLYVPYARRIVGGDDIAIQSRRGRWIAGAAVVVASVATVLAIVLTRPPREPAADTTPPDPAPNVLPAVASLGQPIIGEASVAEGFIRASTHPAPLPGPTVKPAAPPANPRLMPSTQPVDRHGHYRMVFRKEIAGLCCCSFTAAGKAAPIMTCCFCMARPSSSSSTRPSAGTSPSSWCHRRPNTIGVLTSPTWQVSPCNCSTTWRGSFPSTATGSMPRA